MIFLKKKDEVYAMYKGEECLGIGTKKELAELFGIDDKEVEDDDFDLDDICQDLFKEDTEIESFGNSSFIQNVVRSEDEDLVDEEEVITTKHVEETVKKVEPQEEDDEFDFDDEDEFDEIYEQNYREKSMKSTRKNFR